MQRSSFVLLLSMAAGWGGRAQGAVRGYSREALGEQRSFQGFEMACLGAVSPLSSEGPLGLQAATTHQSFQFCMQLLPFTKGMLLQSRCLGAPGLRSVAGRSKVRWVMRMEGCW